MNQNDPPSIPYASPATPRRAAEPVPPPTSTPVITRRLAITLTAILAGAVLLSAGLVVGYLARDRQRQQAEDARRQQVEDAGSAQIKALENAAETAEIRAGWDEEIAKGKVRMAGLVDHPQTLAAAESAIGKAMASHREYDAAKRAAERAKGRDWEGMADADFRRRIIQAAATR